MPIERRQPMAGLYGQAAKLVGQARAAEKQREQAERIQQQLTSIQAQKEMAQFRARLDMRMRQSAEVRAREWELEKMEVASRADFAREEMRRERDIQEYEMKQKAVEESKDLSKAEKDNWQQILLAQYAGISPYIYQRMGVPRAEKPEFGRTDVAAAAKFLQEYEEKERKAEKWYAPFAPEPTETEQKAAEYYHSIIEQIGEPAAKEVVPEAAIAKTYSIGDIIERGGKRYKVVGYDTDGTPLLELIRSGGAGGGY